MIELHETSVTPLHPLTVNAHAPATPPKHLSQSSSTLLVLFAERKCYFIDSMQRTVALNYSVNRNTEYIRQIINI